MKKKKGKYLFIFLGLVSLIYLSTTVSAAQGITDPENDVVHWISGEKEYDISNRPDIDILSTGVSFENKGMVTEVSFTIKVKGKLDLEGKELTILLNTTEKEQFRVIHIYSMTEYHGIGDLSIDLTPRIKGTGTNTLTIVAEDMDIPDDLKFETMYVEIIDYNNSIYKEYYDVASGTVSANISTGENTPGFEIAILIIAIGVLIVLTKRFR